MAVDLVRDISIVHATTPTSQTQHTRSSDGWAFWSFAQKTVSHPLARADRGAHPLARCTLLLPCAKNTLVYCINKGDWARRNARDSLTCASCTFWSSDWKSSAFPLSSSVSLQTPQKNVGGSFSVSAFAFSSTVGFFSQTITHSFSLSENPGNANKGKLR